MSEARILPDVGGRYPKLLVGPLRNFFGTVGLGNGEVIRVAAMKTTNGLVLAVLGLGADEFTKAVSLEDVYESFRVSEDAKAAAGALADLINDQVSDETIPRLGVYAPEACDPYGPPEEEESWSV